MPSKDPNLRRLHARLGAYALHSFYDSRELTANARAAADQRFMEMIDPTGNLRHADPKEAERRAAMARRAHFQRMAVISVQNRKRQQKNEKRRKG